MREFKYHLEIDCQSLIVSLFQRLRIHPFVVSPLQPACIFFPGACDTIDGCGELPEQLALAAGRNCFLYMALINVCVCFREELGVDEGFGD